MASAISVDLKPPQAAVVAMLELLRELVPTATIVTLLVNPTSPTLAETQLRDLQAATASSGALAYSVIRF